MDARERAEKIAIAAWNADCKYNDEEADAIPESMKEEVVEVALAAVRAAYEIDGVEALVMAAENSLIMYGDADDYDNAQEALRAAAARVREAMGGQT